METVHGLTGKSNADKSAFSFRSQGDDICYRKWGDSEIKNNQKVLLMIHGMGYHSKPFGSIMDYINLRGIPVYAMDLRGHGLSGKTKGVMESNEKVLTDIENMTHVIKEENPESKIYLLGTSMGGIYALGYMLNGKAENEISGLILTGIALKLHLSQILQMSNLKLLWPGIFNRSRPVINIDGRKLELSSRNPEWIRSRRNDSLAISSVSADYLLLLHQMKRTDRKKSNLSKISVPVLIQHGGKDKTADVKGAYYLKKNMTNARVELIVYPESYHALLWDTDTERVINDIVNWIYAF